MRSVRRSGKLKIYIASSWKNAQLVLDLARLLRSWDHEVDAFPDISTGRYVFDWREIVENKKPLHYELLQHDHRTKRAFKEDHKFLDWCECCLLLLPTGNSAHLEAGYAKGKNKLLIIFAFRGFEPRKFDVMYGFADLLTDDICKVKSFLEAHPGGVKNLTKTKEV